MWLVLEQRIVTWENLVKIVFHVPSICILCGICEETVNHLFADCNFTKEILSSVLKDLNCDGVWEGGQVSDCILN